MGVTPIEQTGMHTPHSKTAYLQAGLADDGQLRSLLEHVLAGVHMCLIRDQL
jgi:hypothetical protein